MGEPVGGILAVADGDFLEILDAYKNGLGVEPERIVAIGGATNNEFWMQNKADVVGKPIEVPALEEAVPLGAAILAGIGVGLFRDEREAFARVRRPGRVYEPNAQLSTCYRDGYNAYLQLYPALSAIHGRIATRGSHE